MNARRTLRAGVAVAALGACLLATPAASAGPQAPAATPKAATIAAAGEGLCLDLSALKLSSICIGQLLPSGLLSL